MERFKGLIFLILILVVALVAVPVMGAAGEYYGSILVSNNGSADTYCTTNISGIDTSVFIVADYLNSGANNTSITYGGADINFMPGYDTNPWVMMVPSISANTTASYVLNTGVTMGNIRYFPNSNGMTTTDAASIEPTGNFTYEFGGYVDMDQDGEFVTNKPKAYKVYVDGTENITSDIYYGEAETDNFTGSVDAGYSTYGVYWTAQQITYATTYYISSVEVYADILGTPENVDIGIYSVNASGHPDGSTLASGTVNASGWALGWHEIPLDDGYILEGGTQYTAVFTCLGGDAANYAQWKLDTTAPTYAGGFTLRSNDSGATWADNATYDCHFKTNGMEIASVTVGGVTSGDLDIKVNSSPTIPGQTDGNILNFPGTANSHIDTGNLYGGIYSMWVSFWFVLYSDFSAAATTNYYPISNYQDATNRCMVYLDSGDGKLTFWHYKGAVTRFSIESVETSWTAFTPYHVIAAMQDTGAVVNARLIINGGAAVTGADAGRTATPANADFIIGAQSAAAVNDFVGYIYDVCVGTDNLTVGEEADLYNGIAPGDETDYWTMDEGTGTTVNSYGSGANHATIGAANSWGTDERLCTLALDVDGTVNGRHLFYNAPADNANDWVDGGVDATPYIEYVRRYVGGNIQQDIGWDYAATFTDRSGNGNDATPSFMTDCSNTSVNATLVSFLPSEQPQAPGWAVGTGPELLSETFALTGGNYSANISTGMYPGQAFIEELADTTNTPDEFPAVIIATFFITMTSIILGAFLKEHGAVSLVMKIITVSCCIGLAIVLEAYNEAMLILFLLAAFGILFASRERRLGG